jgi:hypothetical protein
LYAFQKREKLNDKSKMFEVMKRWQRPASGMCPINCPIEKKPQRQKRLWRIKDISSPVLLQ